jgi:transcriptional regulator with XRE-family HTH domain
MHKYFLSPRRKALSAKSFLERVDAAMKRQGMNKGGLAKALGIERAGTVSQWWTKSRLPDSAVILRLPEILEVDGHWLLTGEGDMVRAAPTDAQTFVEDVEALLARVKRKSKGLSRAEEKRLTAERADAADRQAQKRDRGGDESSGPPRGDRRSIPRKARNNLG